MVAIVSNPVVRLKISDIDESLLNPRKRFGGLEELAASLRRQQFEAIIVRPHPSVPGRYELANGARRYRAAKLGNIAHLEAKVCTLTDEEMFAIILGTGSEGNVDSLTPLEEAAGFADAMARLTLTLDQAAEKFSKSVPYVHRRLALLQLPEEARGALENGQLAPATAWEIARIPGEDKRAEAATAILHGAVDGGVMASRAAKLYIEKQICRTLQGAPFDSADADLVREAGACGGCLYRAGNNKEAYGDVKNPHTCMNPGCFELKVASARVRVLAREAKEGKTPLPEDANALVFPKGEHGLSWKSDYVAFTQPVTRDLLKPEVSKVPTWAGLCEGRGVKVYVGIDQDGRAVDVAKRDEALAAIPEDDAAIFSEDVVRRHGLAKPSRSGAAGGKASIVAEEEAERVLREKALRSAKKRAKKSREWLTDLTTRLEDAAAEDKPLWTSYTYWSLMFDLMLRALGDEDVLFVCELVGEEIEEGKTARQVLTELVGRMSKGGCGALVTAMTLAPWLRAEGPDAPFVTEWHEAFLEKNQMPADDEAPAVAPKPTISKEEAETLTLMVKGHAAGMSPHALAFRFKMTLEDVCGALQIDVAAARNEVSQLRQSTEESFTLAGLGKPGAMNRITKTATSGRIKTFAELEWPEDFRRVLEMLSQSAKPAPAKVEDSE